jgi:hypothetical protein
MVTLTIVTIYLLGLTITLSVFWPMLNNLALATTIFAGLPTKIAAFILLTIVAVILALVAAYPFVVVNGVNTYIYLAIKEKIKQN